RRTGTKIDLWIEPARGDLHRFMRGIEARPRHDKVAIAGDRLGDETVECRRLEKPPPLARDFLAEREMLISARLAHRGNGRRARRRIAEIPGYRWRLGRWLGAAADQHQRGRRA